MDEDRLFHGVTFTILSGTTITPEREEWYMHLLTKDGATFIPRREDGSINNIAGHTHIITDDIDFPEYGRALEYNVHVVRPSWVISSHEKGRQTQPRQHSPDPSMFFREVIVSCADLPEGDKDAIIAGTLALGGLYSAPLTKLVTHVVSMDMHNDKCRTVEAKQLACKIVLPHWFDDCLKLGKLINEGPYLLPDPEILRATSDEPVRARSTPGLDGALSAVAGAPPAYNPPISPSDSRKQLAVFKDKKVLFSKDLNINDHLAKTLRHLVSQAGGALTTDVEECNVYIGHYRDGIDYVAASRAEKTVGNLSWFYNVINRNKWTNPLGKLLHYPVPRNGIPGFENTRISLSNYSGEARIYLENLCKEAGAEFTKTMKQDNTHLITAHTHSEKCDAAQEWNINIVNHLWLEESYAKCAIQSLTNKRYTHFPPRTNLSEIVGQTTIDFKKVQKIYFASNEKTIKDAEPGAKTPHPFRGAVKAPDTLPRKGVPQSSAATSKARSFADAPEPMDVDDQEDTSEFMPAPQTAKKRKTRVGSDAAMATPSMLRHKEGESTPPTTGRASKEKALTSLHALKDDVLLYDRERKRKGGVVHGGRRTAEPEEAPVTRPTAKGRNKRKSDDTADDHAEISETEIAGVKSKAKKAKTGTNEPEVLFTMMVTGDERWLGNMKKESAETAKLRALGVKLTSEPAECTLLCAPRILRTKKFIAALANSPSVVDIGFLDEALSTNTLPDVDEHLLSDDEAEERLGFRMDAALERGEVNANRLLHGWTIFVTEKVSGKFDTYKEIISINGGTALLYKGRTNVITGPRIPASEDPEAGPETENNGKEEELDKVYLISGTANEEVKLWEKFRQEARKKGCYGRVVKTDWLINLAMSQKVEWDEKWELKEETVPGWEEGRGK
ncbi:hypothetical protein D6D01_05760 [Aureobasidium pullulans]|uniref:BRCT domain-containing protein n=1 Tax=Aureobasidium pullulans TaxID=5580 RepID=A0A4S9L665_AURPU|nr:hypothetical protein D6D01_05760 [Aureobasidium pullulans]